MNHRHHEMNEFVRAQTEDRFLMFLDSYRMRRELEQRPLTQDDYYLAAVLACQNRKERRRWLRRYR